MPAPDYAKLGLKCGLEIHQRLDTRKLFCACESSQAEEPFTQVRRRLRPVAGELGEVDPAALHEFLRDRHFVYKISRGESCLVELDCEPPHPLNEDALQIALEICRALGCTVPDEIHVMRKTVIDGSNTGGFQRTAVVGMNGAIKMPWGAVPINQIALEEESARIEAKSGHETIYRLSGLGIPLVEITTGIINSAKKLQKLAEALGLLLRSFGVQRGIGSIRQDVNISISGGARVEIKGFQELPKMARLVENEAKRQSDLLAIREKLVKRGVKLAGKSAGEVVKDVTQMFSKTKNMLLQTIMKDGGRVFALMLPGFAGLLRHECGSHTLGKELAGYAQAYGIGGIIHTDEDIAKYQLENEFAVLKKEFKTKKPSKKPRVSEHEAERDAFVILAGKMPEVRNAADAVYERAAHLLVGVPEETRFADGVDSKYARPLPGKARMYPETDIPPIKAKMPVKITKTILEKEALLKKQLPKELAEQIMRSRVLPLYERLSQKYEPVLVANTLLSTMKDLKRQGFAVEKITEEQLSALFGFVKEGKMARQAIPEALIMLAQGKTVADIESAFRALSEEELRSIVRSIIKANPGRSEGAIMGIVMEKVRGRTEGQLVAKFVREEMGQRNY